LSSIITDIEASKPDKIDDFSIYGYMIPGSTAAVSSADRTGYFQHQTGYDVM
jgi:hypothetical protein